ncbi:MAG: response regulator [Planctomycetota bacterium]|jgi:CheY-like chemotaxis protein/nitrogen-specific signal transduction histidine kinase
MSVNDNSIQTHEQLQSLLAQKEAAIQAKGRLVDNMAYQIRTLSNAVIGFSDLLLTEDLSEDLMEYVSEINQAGNGLSALVNEVLDWARLESGRLQITKTKCDVSGVIADIEKILAAAVADKGLGYEIQTDPDLPAFILSDADRLLKCVINLIANAIEYTSEGSIRICILPVQQDDCSWVRIDVIDSGVGIPAEKLATIFEPAMYEEQAHEEVLTMLNMGFAVAAGLPLTKQLVEAMGGTLEVTSQLNSGSTFSIILPIELDNEQTAKLGNYQNNTAVEEKPVQESQPPQPSILLVEDQPSNRTVISLMLESVGIQVTTAEDGQEGLEKTSEGQFDLILMDLKMPRMDGYEATRQMRANGVTVPIVALSAKVLNERESHQITTMFDEFLTKPVDSQRLTQAVKQFIPTFQSTAEDPQPADETETVLTFEYGK